MLKIAVSNQYFVLIFVLLELQLTIILIIIIIIKMPPTHTRTQSDVSKFLVLSDQLSKTPKYLICSDIKLRLAAEMIILIIKTVAD